MPEVMSVCSHCGTPLEDLATLEQVEDMYRCPSCDLFTRPVSKSEGDVSSVISSATAVSKPAFPGESANSMLRFLGGLALVGGVIAALLSLAGGNGDWGVVAVIVGLGLLIQGLVVFALFFGLAAMSDNLIGIRQLLMKRESQERSTHGS